MCNTYCTNFLGSEAGNESGFPLMDRGSNNSAERAVLVQKASNPFSPTLSMTDKSNFIDIILPFSCGYDPVKGLGVEHNLNVGSVRSTDAISAIHGDIGYFEISVLREGEQGCIGIGLTSDASQLHKMLGWEKHSIGYHGNDGQLFYESGHGSTYGPKFSTNDKFCNVEIHYESGYCKCPNGITTMKKDCQLPAIYGFETKTCHDACFEIRMKYYTAYFN